MKVLVSLLIVLINLGTSKAQTSNIYKISYDIYYNTDFPMMRKAELYISKEGNYSIFREDLQKKYRWNPKKNKGDDVAQSDYTMTVAKSINERYVENFKIEKEIVMFEDFAKIQYHIQDIYPDFSWHILSDKKIISGIECIKAEGTYRGNSFEVWFTNEIPLSFGPWKFCGLPGLILEAKTRNDEYSFVATKIEHTDTIISLPQVKLKDVTLKKFLEIKEEFYDRPYEVSRDTKFERVKMPRGGLELIYEWE